MSSYVTKPYVAAVPLVLFVLLVAAFIASTALFTTCGNRFAGCNEVSGPRIANLIRPDSMSLDSILDSTLYVSSYATGDSTRLHLVGKKPGPKLGVMLTRLERRYVWSFFAGISAFFSLITLILAVAAVRDAVAHDPRKRLVGAVLMALIPVGLMTVLMVKREDLGGVLYPLLVATVGNADVALNMPRLPAAMAFLNALSSAVAVAMAIAIWMLTWPMHDEPDEQSAVPELELAHLRRKAFYLQLFLYSGTATLVTSVLRMNATIHWMQAYLPVIDQTSFDNLRLTLVTVIGGFYSLLLAVIYLPSAAIIKEQWRSAVASAPKQLNTAPYGVEEMLTLPWTKLLPRAIAILAPVLAGPVGELIKKLAEQ